MVSLILLGSICMYISVRESKSVCVIFDLSPSSYECLILHECLRRKTASAAGAAISVLRLVS